MVPIDVEMWLSVFGRRGEELAAQIADGIIGRPVSHLLPTATLLAGTVLYPSEARGSVGYGKRLALGRWCTITEAYAVAGAAAVDAMPGGRA